MKKLKIGIMFIIFILISVISNNVLAAEDSTKLLYQDITINEDGSITVKEAAWLQGEYNGRLREIEFENSAAVPFTGIYSNFTGNCDIYDGSGIKEVKVYDISQKEFNSIEDIRNVEKTYKQVKSASNGKHGVFIMDENDTGIELKIFCPDKKEKVICTEYTITDAVVVHNDIAELYWNLIGDNYRENIQDFRVVINLPGEDNDVRIWTHGPLTGVNRIVDSKTLEFQDSNVDNYTPETLRIMFNKDLVPLATKKSNIDGKENILKYEVSMADTANAKREQEKLNLENLASEAVIQFEKNPDIKFYYDNALELVNKLDDSNAQKQEYLDRIETALEKEAEYEVLNVEKYSYIFYYNDALELINNLSDDNQTKKELLNRLEDCKTEVNEQWKQSLEFDLELMRDNNYLYLSQYRIDEFIENINEGFDKESKTEYFLIVQELEERLQEKYETIRRTCLGIILISYGILIAIIVLKKVKIEKEKNTYKGQYYREFPSESNPYIIEYLMKKKITALSFSATILNLITKKIIKLEKNLDDEKDIQLVLLKRVDYFTKSEKVVIEALFDVVGNDNICSIKNLKKCAKQASKAIKLKTIIDKFNKYAKEEAEEKRYFQTKSTDTTGRILIIIHYVIMFFILIIGVSFKAGFGWKNLIILIIMSIVSYLSAKIVKQDKNRTEEGKLEYSKWLAHKRFLEDFSNFDEKDLPEIALWEKYLVTATILGCADKVAKKLKLHIEDANIYDDNLLIYMTINENLIRTLNSSVKTTISTANTATYSSSSSSGGGFGGGSSGGGGRRWTAEAAEVVSKQKKTNKQNCLLVFFISSHSLLHSTFSIFFSNILTFII